MKISHFQVSESTSRGGIGALTSRIERLRGVMGVVAVRSMGLMTVLYDERRTDPVAISDEVVQATVEAEPTDEPASCPPKPRRTRRAAHVGSTALSS